MPETIQIITLALLAIKTAWDLYSQSTQNQKNMALSLKKEIEVIRAKTIIDAWIKINTCAKTLKSVRLALPLPDRNLEDLESRKNDLLGRFLTELGDAEDFILVNNFSIGRKNSIEMLEELEEIKTLFARIIQDKADMSTESMQEFFEYYEKLTKLTEVPKNIHTKTTIEDHF